MLTQLRKKDVYVGQSPYSREERYHVLGSAFGPMLLCADCDLEEAFDEWTERHCEPFDPNDSAIQDYKGETLDARIEDAMNEGELRMTSGGTLAWADHYEWCRSFKTGREAGRYFRTCMDR